MTESVFRGRSLLSTRDYTKDELMYLIGFAEHLKDLEEVGRRASLPRRQEHRALVREDVHPHPRRVHHRVHRPGRAPRVSGQERHPAGQEGDGCANTALVLGSMFDGIEFRGFKQEHVEDLAKYSGVPVWNGLTDKEHPPRCWPTS